jgi:acetolactate synthase-1/2/3 large subunit
MVAGCESMMKLSDYVALFLARQGIRHVFAISGGASIHLIHSVAKTPGIDFVCPQHEQAGAMAADAYARATRNLGCAISTSGPGATNMLTGVCCAYYDSVPVLYITGQVATFRQKGDTGVRQIGFQETDTVAIYRPVTKYAIQVTDPRRIRYELEKAVYLAKSGRPGPVLLDLPDDLQRSEIDPEELESFRPEQENSDPVEMSVEKMDRLIELLRKAHRPIVILGSGIRLSKAEKEAKKLVEGLGLPVAPTWGMMDFLPSDHPLVVGGFGTHGTRYGNFAVQNADLVLVIGARLDTREAGWPFKSFAREANKIVVDVDINELNKFEKYGMQVDLKVHSDAKQFLTALCARMEDIVLPDMNDWKGRICEWKSKYPICPPRYYEEEDVNPYVFFKTLSKASCEGAAIVLDTGCALAWMMQAFDVKRNQKIFHDFNNTAMGYALPASMGVSLALNRGAVICVTGDGSLQMNIQELATVTRHQLPIKIFLLNNHGHSMIQQTQDQWLGSKYYASSVKGGLASPDFVAIARAYGFKTFKVERNQDLGRAVGRVLTQEGPVFCNVEIRPEHRVSPQTKFGRPIEDSEPLLDRNEFLSNMIVKPEEISLENVEGPSISPNGERENSLLGSRPKSKRLIREVGRTSR